MRSRSRTICLSLAFVTVSLYLLLALISLSIHQQPHEPSWRPKTHILRELAHTSGTSAGLSGPTYITHGDSSIKDASKEAKDSVRALSDVHLVKTGIKASVNTAGDHNESVESGLSKLKALFDHPLYNMPVPPVQEEDWLLRVRSKVTAREKSSQMWSVF